MPDEWKPLVEAEKPYLIQRRDHKPFVFAGMWDKVKVKDQTVDACAILTTKPEGVMSEVHDRMPVILPADVMMKWLDPNARYRALLEPDADSLELVPVSSLVNAVKNDDPRCAEPLAG